MPVATYRSEGFSIDYTPTSNVTAGDIVDLGQMVGIAAHDIPANVKGSLQTRGVYDVTKFTGEAIAQFALVYYDQGTNTATGTVGYSEAIMGIAVTAAAAGDATVQVLVFPRTS